MLLLVSVHLIILIHLIHVPLSLLYVFISLCAAFAVLALVFLPGLYSAAYMTVTPFSRSLLRIFFLPLRVLCGRLLSVPVFFAFVLCSLLYFFITSLLCPFLATMFFAGYFLNRFLLFSLLFFLRTCSQFDLVWFRLSCDHGCIRSGSVHLI